MTTPKSSLDLQHCHQNPDIQPETATELCQEDFEDLDYSTSEGPCAKCINTIASGFQTGLLVCLPVIKYGLAAVLVVGYIAYFSYAMYCSFGDEDSIRLLWLTCTVVCLVVLQLFRKFFGKKFYAKFLAKRVEATQSFLSRHSAAVFVTSRLLFLVYFFGILIAVGSQNSGNLISVIGVILILLAALLLSKHPTRVNCRPVMVGLAIQVTLAALVLRTRPGLEAFRFLGDRVGEFKGHVESGSEFVFGTNFRDHFFAFAVLPVLVFVSSFVALFFHLGILQTVIQKLGWLMQKTMGTTAAESLVAAAEMFVGQGPLLIQPFLGRLTNSELYAVITSGYATIPVGTLAAYISLGVPAAHLISASVLMAPGALALSKLMYPETKKSKTDTNEMRKIKINRYRNAIDALGTGAINSIQLVASIAVNLIAFISMLTFLNKTLTWFGRRACLKVDLTFEFICSYLFWPIAFVIGISPSDCSQVAELIGVKFFINEFVAYQRLSIMRQNRQKIMAQFNDTERYYWERSNQTLSGGLLYEDRSETIAIYALCGFANIGTVGIFLGLLSAMIPGRKSDFVPLVSRAVITGTLANLLAASIAGVFYSP